MHLKNICTARKKSAQKNAIPPKKIVSYRALDEAIWKRLPLSLSSQKKLASVRSSKRNPFLPFIIHSRGFRTVFMRGLIAGTAHTQAPEGVKGSIPLSTLENFPKTRRKHCLKRKLFPLSVSAPSPPELIPVPMSASAAFLCAIFRRVVQEKKKKHDSILFYYTWPPGYAYRVIPAVSDVIYGTLID